MVDDNTIWSYPAAQVERTGRRYGWVSGDWTEKAYLALIEDQRWNGWAVPLFDLEAARRIVEDQETNPELGADDPTLEWSGNNIVLRNPCLPGGGA